MAAKNLISIRQIRENELLAFVLDNSPALDLSGSFSILSGQVSGLISSGIGGGGSSNASGVSFPIGSGVDEIQIIFPTQSRTPFVSATVFTSGSGDPYLLSNVVSKNTSGCLVGLSATTISPNYYLDLLFSV